MTKALTIVLPALLVLALVGCSRNFSGQAPNPADGSEWQVLFDGTSVDAFRGYKREDFPHDGWRINEDGSLQVLAGEYGDDIVTRQKFGDFDLRFDWKVSEGANSGVIYRVAEGEEEHFRLPFMTGPEYQLLDDDRHPNGKNPKTSAAALYGLIACNDNKKLMPVGEWNTGRIVVQNNRVEHWLNGELVVSYELNSEPFVQMVANGWGRDWPGFAKQETGYISFQDHRNDVWFRNIRIRELNTPAD